MSDELPPTPPDALAAAEDERTVQQMVDYLREHGSQYETEALRQQLLSAGQRPDLVELAISRAEVSGPAPKERTWPRGLLVAAGNLVLLIVIFSVAATGTSDPLATVAALPLLVLAGELIAGLVLLNSPRRRLGKALLWGVLFSIVIPIIFILLLVGICLVLVAGSSGSLFR